MTAMPSQPGRPRAGSATTSLPANPALLTTPGLLTTPALPFVSDDELSPVGSSAVLALPPHAFLRGDTALRLARFLVAAYPRLPLSAGQLARLSEQLPVRLATGSPRERTGLLAVGAALGPRLSPAARAAVRRISRLGDLAPGTAEPVDAAESVAAHLTGLLADGYPISDVQLADLATLVGSPAALLSLAARGDVRRRTLALVLAIAEQATDPSLPPV